MRTAISKLVVAAALAVAVWALAPASSVRAETGLTITPATLTLTLAKGQTEKTVEFLITNHYDRLVTLNFAVEPGAGAAEGTDPGRNIHVRQNFVMLEPDKSLKQAVTLTDNKQLPPGSTLAELVITQSNTTGASVGVRSSIRLPLVLVKEDGAVRALALAGLDGPGLSLSMPGSLTTTIHNSGNVVAIPRGFVTITAPGGQVLSSGALNTASLAAGAGDRLALQTPLNKVASPLWPGVYQVHLSYGPGGGQAAQTSSTWFLYVAWWHLALMLGLTAAAYYFRKQVLQFLKSLPKQLSRTHHPPPKRTMLIGRDIT